MTTARQVWEGMLTELSKVNAPSLLLHEFNYYFNKAIYQYINKRYNIYDVNQQTTDDLRVLKATAVLPVTKIEKQLKFDNKTTLNLSGTGDIMGATYEVYLPDDYLHMLNCICIYNLQANAENCYDKGDNIMQSATRLTADSWSGIINDYYNRPTPWKPYYYIHNVNLYDANNDFVPASDKLPTNPIVTTGDGHYNGTDLTTNNPFPELIMDSNGSITKTSKAAETIQYIWECKNQEDKTTDKNIPPDPIDGEEWELKEIKSTLNVKNGSLLNTQQKDNNLRKNPAFTRQANASRVRCEIRYGTDDSIYKLQGVLVDYIKAPQRIRLTKKQIDLTTDTSQIMEFPDYVCQEIINELTMLVMARTSDPRLQTLMVVSLSIANPQLAQAAPQTTQQQS